MIERSQPCKDLLATLPKERRELAEKLAQNQMKYLVQLADEVSEKDTAQFVRLTGLFGPNWKETFIRCFIGRFAEIPLPDMVRFEAAEGPIHNLDIATYHYESTEEGDARVSLHFDTMEVRMQPRKAPVLDLEDNPHALGCTRPMDPPPVERLNMWLEEMFLGYQREVFGTMRTCAETNGVVEVKSVDDLMPEIERQSSHIHRKSFTGPGNKILTSPETALELPIDRREEDVFANNIKKIGVLANGKWDVYADPYFPKDDLLLWRHAETTGHSGIAAILYRFGFGGGLSGHSGQIGGRIRYANMLLKPEFFKLLRIV